uniref:Putative structural protein n=1 Tax=viral metagenome TaxID=1070528 RepID=A0A6M3J4K4_9ZZZZ
MIIADLLAGGVFSFAGKILDKIFPDPNERAQAEVLLKEADRKGELDQLNAQMQVMLAEAKSSDKWTSRARPSFMYVIYLMIITAIPMGIVHAINPGVAENVTIGVRAWLTAVPSELWTLFGLGYLGYVGGRSYDKKKLIESIARVGEK